MRSFVVRLVPQDGKYTEQWLMRDSLQMILMDPIAHEIMHDMPPTLQNVLSVIGAIVFVVIIAYRMRPWLLKRGARNWPLVTASVETNYTFFDRHGHGWTLVLSVVGTGWSFVPVLGYSYEVDGEAYSGYIGLNGSRSYTRKAAEEAGSAWRGKRITVRYDPQKPQKSAFLREDGAPRRVVNYADQPPIFEGDDGDIITLSLK